MFYYQAKVQQMTNRHAALKERIQAIYEEHRYGYRRITAALLQAVELIHHKAVPAYTSMQRPSPRIGALLKVSCFDWRSDKPGTP